MLPPQSWSDILESDIPKKHLQISLTPEVNQQVLEVLAEVPFSMKIATLKEAFLNNNDDKVAHLFEDSDFLKDLNNYIFSSFREIAIDSSLDSYNEVYFFVYLLSFRWGENIFQWWDIYSQDSFAKLFDSYTQRIKNFQDINSGEAEIEVERFARLCWLLNLICVLNQNNNLKREFIFSLVDYVTIKIQEILWFLEKKWSKNHKLQNSLQYILGLFSLNFSYIQYVSFQGTQEDKFQEFLNQYHSILSQTILWYNQCELANFWNDMDRKNSIDKVKLINIACIVSLVILKIENEVDEKECYNHPTFSEILKLFSEVFISIYPEQKHSLDSFATIKEVCNYIFINEYETFPKELLQTPYDCEDFLRKISYTNFTPNVGDLEIIYHVLLFNSHISHDTMFRILDALSSHVSSTNINFEVIRLKILNVIFTRLATHRIDKLKPYLSATLNYIDKYKISSHLLFVYSLMYISIWYCYSFYNQEEDQKKASEYYSKFRQINHWEFDYSRYGIDFERFTFNIWIYLAVKYKIVDTQCEKWINQCKSLCYDSKQLCHNINFDQIAKWWEGTLTTFSDSYIEQRVGKSFNDLDTFLLSSRSGELNLSELNDVVSSAFSSIFHGVAEVELIDKKWESMNAKFISRYHTYKEISIINGYKLRMIYPSTFASYFEELYNRFSQTTNHNLEIWEWVIGVTIKKLWILLEKFDEKNAVALELIDDFKDALLKGRIHIVYQWIYNDDRKIVKFEMLSRIKDSRVISDKVYNIRDYLDVLIEKWKHDTLCQFNRFILQKAKQIIKQYPHISLSINMEYTDLIDTSLIQDLENMKKKWFPTHQITFELIEKKWDDNNVSLQNIKKLRELWYKIAMDDFSVWDSGVARLKELLKERLLDYVKIDGDIIKDLLSDNTKNRQTAKKIVEFVVSICDIWWVKVVAEFVENEKLYQELIDLWVHFFQWYALSKPKNLDEIIIE